MPQLRNKNGSGRLGLLMALLLLLAAAVAAAANLRGIADWLELRSYQPPAAVASLASQDGMTASARKIFYVNHPVIEDKDTFNNQCPNNGGEQTIVLGCYHGNQDGIYLLNVTDARLNGVEQVTAAHEMLHAAYDRLSNSDRQKVDAMLLDYYNHGLHDQRLLNTIAAYKKTEPRDLVNEMHSVFGTEVASLPNGLEAYYKRYFSNRAQIAAFAAQYQGVFTSQQQQLAQLKTQLANLKAEIDTNEAELNAKQAQINSEQQTLAAERNSGNLTAYNYGVSAYNAQVNSYNAQVDSTRALIEQYNQLVQTYNSLVTQQDQLINELSSQPTPISP